MVGDLLQPTHLLFVLVVALLVLGPKRLPEVGRALGRGLRDFRSAISGEEPPEQAISPTDQAASAPTAVHSPEEASAPTVVQVPEQNTAPRPDTQSPSQASEPAETVTSSTRIDSGS